MNRFYTFIASIGFLLLTLGGVQAQTSYTCIGGTMEDKTKLFDATYLQTLDQELTTFAAANGYTIYLDINAEVLDPRKNTPVTEQFILNAKNDRREDVLQQFKKKAKANPKLNNGIILNLDILFKNTFDTTAGLESYFMQTIVPGKALNSYSKTGLTSIAPMAKPAIGAANYTVNQQALQKTIDAIKALFVLARTQPKDNFLFGPLTVNVQSPNITNASGSFKSFTSTQTSFTLTLRTASYQDLEVVVTDASISFLYDPTQGTYKNVAITRAATATPIFAGHQVFLNIYATAINLAIEDATGVNGSVTLKTLTDRDIELQNLLVLKQGFGGNFQYNYSNSSDLSGTYNFSGLSNFEVDFIKDRQLVAAATGTVNSNGSIQATLATTQAVTVNAANFSMLIQNLNLQFTFSIKDGISIQSGSLSAVFSGIPGLDGNIPVTATYDQYGNIVAGLQTNGLTLSVCTMQIVNPSLNIALDNNLNLITVEGSASMKHSAFNTPVAIDQLRWSDDQGIEIFSAKGNVKYQNFDFALKSFEYDNGSFRISAQVALNTIGTSAYIDVTDFTIDEDGSIDIGAINGKIQANLVDFTFQATFGQNRFTGGFSGKIANLISAEGSVDIGQYQPATGASYTFCYLKLVVGSSSGIPLAPLPLKLTKFGGEYGYNYFIDYQNKSNPPTGPVKGNYIVGLTIGVADITGSIAITGNPVAQIGSTGASLTMNGNISVPSVNPWFNVPVQAGFSLPSGEIYGGFNFNFQIPKTTGSIVNANNLGFDFLFNQTQWYVGRKGMSVSLFNALELDGDVEFSGGYTSSASYRAFMAAKLALDWQWSGSQTVSILSYDLVTAKASLGLTVNASASLDISNTGMAGSFNASMAASGSVELDVCPSCNYSWTKVQASVNASVAGGIDFQNTNVHLYGNGNFQATVLGTQGSFSLAIDYTFDPTKNGSGTTTAVADANVRAVPVSAAAFTVPTNMPAAGAGQAAQTQYNQQKASAVANPVTTTTNANYVSSLAAYTNINNQLTANNAQIAAVEGRSVLESKLKSSGTYVLTKLNNESVTNGAVLVLYAKYIQANAGAERDFATDKTAFDNWLTDAKATAALANAPTTLSSYPNLKANLTALTSQLQSVEGSTTLQSKLQGSGGYVMSKLNGESSNILLDYAKYLKANSGAEGTFKNNTYAFDEWLAGDKSSAGSSVELTSTDLPAALIGNDGGANELTYASKVIAPSKTIDIIIHASGGTYFFEVNGSKIANVDQRTLAGWIKSKGYNTGTIRLLSCSDINSAQNLCNKLNQNVIATGGYVCIYSDGGISVLPGNGNTDINWYLLKPNGTSIKTDSPREPGTGVTDYVQMGGPTEKERKILIIGEGQGCVDEAARIYKQNGYLYAESMMYPVVQWKGGALPFDNETKLTTAINWNTIWIQKKIEDGFIIIDIGPDGRNSVFYTAEIAAIKQFKGTRLILKNLPNGESVIEMRNRIKCTNIDDNY